MTTDTFSHVLEGLNSNCPLEHGKEDQKIKSTNYTSSDKKIVKIVKIVTNCENWSPKREREREREDTHAHPASYIVVTIQYT